MTDRLTDAELERYSQALPESSLVRRLAAEVLEQRAFASRLKAALSGETDAS